MSHRDLHPLTRSRISRAKIAALALLCSGVLFTQANASQPQFVAAQGRIIPGEGIVAIAASHDGGTPIVRTLDVSEGAGINAGQQLATLATLPALEAAFAEAKAQANVASSRIQVAIAAELTAQARLKAAAEDVALAEKGVAEARAAQDAAEKALVEADARAQAQQATISGTWTENQRILDKDSPPAREAAQLRFEQKTLNLQKAEIAASQAGTALRLQSQIEQAKAAVETAQQRVVAAQAAKEVARSDAESALANITGAQGESLAALEAVERAKLLGLSAIIRAPMDGTVLQINARPGEVVSPEGLLLLGNLTKLYVEAEVYIDDLRHVKTGQKARITGEAFAGEITGSVERIGNMVTVPEIFARDPAAFTDQRVVRVRIALDAGGELPTLPVNSRVLVRIDR